MINTYNCDYRELFRNTADKAYDLAIVHKYYDFAIVISKYCLYLCIKLITNYD